MESSLTDQNKIWSRRFPELFLCLVLLFRISKKKLGMYTFDSPPKLKQTTKFLYLFSRLNSSTRAQCSICLMWVAKDLNVKSGFTVLTTQIASFLCRPCLNMTKFFWKTPVSIECRYSIYIRTVSFQLQLSALLN